MILSKLGRIITPIVISFLIVMPQTVFAASIDVNFNTRGVLTIVAEHNGNRLSGFGVEIIRVADLVEARQDGIRYTLSEAFRNSGVTEARLTNMTAEENLYLAGRFWSYAISNNIQKNMRSTDNTGRVRFADLAPGLYLVSDTVRSSTDTGHIMQSFLVPVPHLTERGLNYIVTASPKIQAQKVTPTPSPQPTPPPPSSQPPQPPPSAQPQGQIATPSPPPPRTTPPVFRVEEQPIPLAAAPTPSPSPSPTPGRGPEYEWVLTEQVPLRPLAQTGMIRWPIQMLTLSGAGMLLTGAVMLRKGKKES